jgi:rhodanese-related sulfurtransferase
MPVDINRDEVRRLVAEGAQLVEVLPPEEYAHEHLPGAISVPLGAMQRSLVERRLVRQRPVIVYCQDTE